MAVSEDRQRVSEDVGGYAEGVGGYAKGLGLGGCPEDAGMSARPISEDVRWLCRWMCGGCRRMCGGYRRVSEDVRRMYQWMSCHNVVSL